MHAQSFWIKLDMFLHIMLEGGACVIFRSVLNQGRYVCMAQLA